MSTNLLSTFEKAAVPVDVSVVLVNFNTANLLERCIGQLRQATEGLRVQVIVVDNASADGSLAWLREHLTDGLVMANEINVGFGRATNQALPHCNGRYVLLLNTDAFVEAEALRKTTQFLDANLHYGVLGVRLIGPDGEQQPSCRFFPTPLNVFLGQTGLNHFFPRIGLVDRPDWDPTVVQECDWVPGCFYVVRREVIAQVGLFDPRYFLYFEEVDHCRAVKAAGWGVVYYPGTSVVHLGGASAKVLGTVTSQGSQISELQIESELLYFRKHHGRLGAVAGLLLATLTDLILFLKGAIRMRSLSGAAGRWRHLVTSWVLYRRTSWGSRPTR